MSCVKDREGVYNIVGRFFIIFIFAFSSLAFILPPPPIREMRSRTVNRQKQMSEPASLADRKFSTIVPGLRMPTYHLPTYRTVQHGRALYLFPAGRQASNIVQARYIIEEEEEVEEISFTVPEKSAGNLLLPFFFLFFFFLLLSKGG